MSLMPEVLTEPPVLTDEDILMLVKAAEQRIETDENGGDRLDGYLLPPSNDEVWDARMIKGSITTVLWNGDALTGIIQEEFERPSTLTNRMVRETNIRMVSQGKEPFYKTWDQVRYPVNSYKRPSLFQRVNEWKGKLFSTFWLN